MQYLLSAFKDLKRKKRGFTLVEIMLVITIISILFVVLVPRLGFATDKAKEAGVKTDFRAFQTAAEASINEKSFMKFDDGTVDSYLNEYLDESLAFTNGVSFKANPYGYNYRLVLTKNPNDPGSGTLEFLSIKGMSSGVSTYSAGDDLISASGTKLVLTIENGKISSDTVEFKEGDVSLIPSDKTPVGIQISQMPKTNFTVGDSFTYSGLQIKVLQADGSYRTSTDYTVITPSMTIGTHSVTVKFNENTALTTQYSITVKAASSGSDGENNNDSNNNNNENTNTAKTLTGLGISNTPTQMSYQAGDTINLSGMIISAYFSDGSSLTVTDACSYTGTLTLGQTSIVFTYTYEGVNKSVTLNGLSVTSTGNIEETEKELNSLTITSYPTKMSYTQGELLDTSGLVIKANYSDSTSEIVTGSCVYNSNLLVGQTSVIFNYTYNGVTRSITLSGLSVTAKVEEEEETVTKTLSSISISGSFKLLYSAGENFDTTGLSVIAIFSDGTSADVSSLITHDGYNLQTSTTKVNIYYEYGGVRKVAQATISVKKILNSISIEQQPLKTVGYIEGENVNTSGLQVTAYFNDNTSADVTDEVVITNNLSLQVGWTTVGVSYTFGDVTKKASFQVYAEEKTEPEPEVPPVLERIAVTTLPTKTVYWEGESFEDAGIVITAYYDNGSSKGISGYIFSNHTNLTAGTRTIMVTFQEDDVIKNTTFDIIVKTKPLAEYERISVTKAPTKTTYYKNEEFEPTGMVVHGYYPSELDLSPEVISLENLTFSNTTITKDGQYIIIQYTRGDGQVVGYQYQVHMAGDLASIAVTKNPDRLEYVVGETFDITGMELTATFEDGLTSVVEPTSYSTDPLQAGQTFVTIIYSHNGVVESVNLDIVVKAQVSKIEITTPPDKVKYRIGGVFDTTGMVVTATYADNTTEDVSDRIEVVDGTDLPEDKTTVTIKYTWVNTTVTVKQEISVVDTVSKAIAAGINTSFFIDEKENVYAFGLNSTGQLGVGNTTTNIIVPTLVQLSYVKQIFTSMTSPTTFFICGDGSVYATGQNNYGQLGIDNTTNQSTPQKLDLPGKAKKVATGTYHTLILLEDGSLYACGLNTSGQLGLAGLSTNRTVPTKVTGLTGTIKDIEAAGNHSFILMTNGRVYVMGDNTSGQLGTNSTTTQTSPWILDNSQMGNISKVYTTTTHTIFEAEDGRFFATGINTNGELMIGDVVNRIAPTYNDEITNMAPLEIILRPNNTLLVCADKTFKVSGLNANGELMTGDLTKRTSIVTITPPEDYKEFAFGINHHLCSDDNGELRTYGQSNNYQCGLGDTTTRWAWNYIFNNRSSQKMLIGNAQVWVKDSHGQIWVSGKNNYGQLGIGNTTTYTNFVLSTNTTFANLFDDIDYVVQDMGGGGADTNYGNIFVMKDGSMYVAGYGTSGGYNLGMPSNYTTITKMTGYTGIPTKIQQYNYHLGFLTDTGDVYVSGKAAYISNTSTNEQTSLRKVASGIKAYDSFVYGASSNAYQEHTWVFDNGTVYGGASGGSYPLGNNYGSSNANYNLSQSSVNKTIHGPGFTFLLKDDKTLWVSGYNSNGYLGTGNTDAVSSFKKIFDSDNEFEIAHIFLTGNMFAGSTNYYTTSYILTTDGDVYASGNNNYGLTGQGLTSGNITTFTKIEGLSGVTEIKTGNYCTFFITDSAIYVLGKNQSGHLGIGTTEDATELTQVQIDRNKVADMRVYYDRVIYEMTDGSYRLVGNMHSGWYGNTHYNTLSVPQENIFEYTIVA